MNYAYLEIWPSALFFAHPLLFIIGLAIIAGAGADVWSDLLTKGKTIYEVWVKNCYEMEDCATAFQKKALAFYGMFCSFLS